MEAIARKLEAQLAEAATAVGQVIGLGRAQLRLAEREPAHALHAVQ